MEELTQNEAAAESQADRDAEEAIVYAAIEKEKAEERARELLQIQKEGSATEQFLEDERGLYN